MTNVVGGCYFQNMKEILKELRRKSHYSQDVIAKILDVSRQTYIKYESGEVEPSVDMVRKLSKAYGVSYSVLIDNNIEALNGNDLSSKSGLNQLELSRFGEKLNELQSVITSLQTELKEIKDANITVTEIEKKEPSTKAEKKVEEKPVIEDSAKTEIKAEEKQTDNDSFFEEI